MSKRVIVRKTSPYRDFVGNKIGTRTVEYRRRG